MQHQRLSQLMYLLWEIQRRKKTTRSKSLLSAWAISLNEDITIYHLVKRHNVNQNKIKTECYLGMKSSKNECKKEK